MSKTETYRKNQVLCRSAAKLLCKAMTIAATLLLINACTMNKNNHLMVEEVPSFKPFAHPVAFEDALKKADSIVSSLTLDEQIEMIGGHNMFFVKGVEKFNIPQWYLSDATQGVHLRKTLDSQLEKSVAMPCPIMLASTWNRQLAFEYARSVGEECRAGGIAVLLGPGKIFY
jgi:beta-glucosidase